ncbi:MAG: hypothetical protein AAB909_04905 [Patescibacteria group bacterium]
MFGKLLNMFGTKRTLRRRVGVKSIWQRQELVQMNKMNQGVILMGAGR